MCLSLILELFTHSSKSLKLHSKRKKNLLLRGDTFKLLMYQKIHIMWKTVPDEELTRKIHI